MTEQEKIADRIRKMVAKAGSTSSREESMMIMEKVEEMLTRHGMTLLEAHLLDQRDPVVGGKGEEMVVPRGLGYAKIIISSVCRYYGVEVVFSGLGRDQKATLFGRQSAVQTAHIMVPYIFGEINRLAAHGHREGKFRTKTVGMTAVGNALAMRITELIQAQNRATKAGGNALVPFDEIKALIRREFPFLRGRTRRVSVDEAARKLAEQVSLARQVGGNRLVIGR